MTKQPLSEVLLTVAMAYLENIIFTNIWLKHQKLIEFYDVFTKCDIVPYDIWWDKQLSLDDVLTLKNSLCDIST